MPDIEILKGRSVEDLLRELKARAATTGKTVPFIKEEPHKELENIDDATIARVLKENQKVIYGTDNRVDVFQLPPGPDFEDADSVVALFHSGNITDNGNGTSTLQTVNFGLARNLCPGERFREQPTGLSARVFLSKPT